MQRKRKFNTSLRRISPASLLMLTVAGIINSIGVTMFLGPVNLYDSGISGTSMFLSQITPEYLSLSVFLLILNIPLFLYGFRRQGILFTFYAIYTIAVYSISAWLITDILPVDVSFASPLADQDLLLCALFGGVISGIGSGLAIRFGGAMDGIEVMAVIFAKRIGISVGTFVMVYNMLLYIICGIVMGSWILPLYSIVAYAAALKTVDYIVEGIDREKCAMIVTSMPNEVCAAISEEFESGVTVLEAKGGYSGNEMSMVYFVVNRFQVVHLKELVCSVDPKAHISVYEVADVFHDKK